MTLAAADLNPKQFQKISDMVYRTAGINLKEGKEALVRARLMKRLRFLGMSRVEDYIEFIDSDQGTGEVAALIDVMTTNKTSFFREVDHFHFLREQMNWAGSVACRSACSGKRATRNTTASLQPAKCSSSEPPSPGTNALCLYIGPPEPPQGRASSARCTSP